MEKDDTRLNTLTFNLGEKSLGVRHSDAILFTKIEIDEHQSVLQQLVVTSINLSRAEL